MVFWGIKLLCSKSKFEKASIVANISMQLILEKESKIQDLWNRKSKSNVNRSDGGYSTLVKTHVKLYVLHLSKQSTTFNGDSWSLIDKDVFYNATSNFKLLIFNVYKNLFESCEFCAVSKNTRIFHGISMAMLSYL